MTWACFFDYARLYERSQASVQRIGNSSELQRRTRLARWPREGNVQHGGFQLLSLVRLASWPPIRSNGAHLCGGFGRIEGFARLGIKPEEFAEQYPFLDVGFIPPIHQYFWSLVFGYIEMAGAYRRPSGRSRSKENFPHQQILIEFKLVNRVAASTQHLPAFPPKT